MADSGHSSQTTPDEAKQLRKDPFTNTWVLQLSGEPALGTGNGCRLCPGAPAGSSKTLYQYPLGTSNWQVRVIPHFHPLYRVESDARRQADGIYDRMQTLGAHEIVVEHPEHRLTLSRQSDEHVAQVLRAYASRIADLKKDRRLRHVTVFRNQGRAAGQDFEHPHSEITATPFIPRRVGYKLRWCQRHFAVKERCLTCDILKQELTEQARTIEWDDIFVAFCPYASRVPYETWLVPLNHHHLFEEDINAGGTALRFARILKSTLRRLEMISSSYHLVLHTSPNLNAKFERKDNWQTIAEDYHWHIEILPVIPQRSKSYSFKEVYYNTITPEYAAQELRKLTLGA